MRSLAATGTLPKIKLFELADDYDKGRRILAIVYWNFTLDGIKLVPTIKKPFDMLVEGLLVPSSGGGGI